MKKDSKQKVLVGMSGGVDSAVTAFLLKKEGFSPIGIFIKTWNEDLCISDNNQDKIREICDIIDIPFYTIDAKDEFKRKIVNSFIRDYKKGITPNPCVTCNREIKFNILIDSMSAFDAGYIATGHYAQKIETSPGNFVLKKGVDENKDQSYFLWNIKKEWLKNILFPLGQYTKKEVRSIAKKNKLPVFEEKESQEVCFINDSITNFLDKNIKPSPGEIIDDEKNVIGQHEGLFHYTIGQRKRIGLSGGPYYVLSKKIKDNVLIVTKDKNKLPQKEFSFGNANFLDNVSFPFDAEVKIRYNTNTTKATVEKNKVIFSTMQRAITPGQSVVFYKNDNLLGGGIIK